jgi:hypothetical protein
MRKKVRQVGKPVLIILASLAVLLSLSGGLGIFYRYRNALDEANAEMKKRKPEVEAVENEGKRATGKRDFEINKVVPDSARSHSKNYQAVSNVWI